MIDDRTDEEKAKSKRVHALVMIVLGAIMSLCALAAGLIALTPGVFPSWMTGGWGRRETPAYRAPSKMLGVGSPRSVRCDPSVPPRIGGEEGVIPHDAIARRARSTGRMSSASQ